MSKESRLHRRVPGASAGRVRNRLAGEDSNEKPPAVSAFKTALIINNHCSSASSYSTANQVNQACGALLHGQGIMAPQVLEVGYRQLQCTGVLLRSAVTKERSHSAQCFIQYSHNILQP